MQKKFREGVIFRLKNGSNIVKKTITMRSNATDEELRYVRLLGRYRAHIVSYCSRHCDSADEAADMVQEVMIAIWEGLEGLRRDSSPQHVNRWLQKVMRTTYVRHLRARPRHTTVPIEAAGSVVLNDCAVSEMVEELLSRLSPDDRKVVCLRMEGYDNSEIAAELGVSTNNVNQRFFRIVNRLKRIYLHIYG